jgi:hypothetical protein
LAADRDGRCRRLQRGFAANYEPLALKTDLTTSLAAFKTGGWRP